VKKNSPLTFLHPLVVKRFQKDFGEYAEEAMKEWVRTNTVEEDQDKIEDLYKNRTSFLTQTRLQLMFVHMVHSRPI
jgi:hypothetical protein